MQNIVIRYYSLFENFFSKAQGSQWSHSSTVCALVSISTGSIGSFIWFLELKSIRLWKRCSWISFLSSLKERSHNNGTDISFFAQHSRLCELFSMQPTRGLVIFSSYLHCAIRISVARIFDIWAFNNVLIGWNRDLILKLTIFWTELIRSYIVFALVYCWISQILSFLPVKQLTYIYFFNCRRDVHESTMVLPSGTPRLWSPAMRSTWRNLRLSTQRSYLSSLYWR